MGSQPELLRAEIAREQEHVDTVYARVAEVAELARELAREGYGRVVDVADLGGIREEHYRGLYERDVLVNHAARRVATLDAQHEGLVFGRLDQRDGEVRYIGRIGIRDAEHDPLVIDWRAPAGAVFYQATAVDPQGVVRRRVLRSTGARIVGLEDDLLDADAAPADLPVIGEGALLAALAQSRGTTMRDIVSTIQREQDEIIRAPGGGATLITGGPGTGKTVVALHRAAYLLYSNRRRFESGGVLVVGPSRIFMNYIERVLPSLGEDAATLRSLGELRDGVRAIRHDPPEVAAVKGSAEMRRVLSHAVRDSVPDAPEALAVYAGGRILRLDARELAAIRTQVLRHHRRNRARGEAVRALVAALWSALDEPDPSRPVMDRDRFAEEVRGQDGFRRFVAAWWPALTPEDVVGWLADPARARGYAAGTLRDEEVALLARSWDGVDGPSIEDVGLLDEVDALLGAVPDRDRARDDDGYGSAGATGDGGAAGTAARYDEVTTITDRLFGVREPAPRAAQYDGYAHILVDEAQDLSPMQWRMLGRRGRSASWTVVGDPAQSAWPDPAAAEQAREQALGRRTRQVFRLETNYRNAAEIFDLACRVARRAHPEVALPAPIRRTGVDPVHHLVPEPDRPAATRGAVAVLLDELAGTVAAIAPEALLEQVRDWLGGLDGDRVSVVSAVGSKGLEYDGVVLVEPDAIVAESRTGDAALYVALTRATQRLVTVGSGRRWRPADDDRVIRCEQAHTPG